MTDYERLSLKLQLAIARGQLLLMSTSENGLANSIIEHERCLNAIEQDADQSLVIKALDDLHEQQMQAMVVKRQIDLLTLKFKELTGKEPPVDDSDDQ